MEQNKSLWNRDFLLLLVVSVLTTTVFNMVQPVLPQYAVSLGSGLSTAGVLAGLFSATALFMRPVAGFFSDRYNQKWLMFGSMLLNALAVLSYIFVTKIPVLFVVRIIHGITFAISSTIMIALATSFVPDEKLGQGVGLIALGQALANAIGPNMGLTLAELFDYRMTFVASSACALTTCLVMLAVHYRKPPASAGAADRIHFKNLVAKDVLPIAALAILPSGANGLMTSYLSMFAEGRGLGSVGFYFTFCAMFMLLIRPLAGRLTDRFPLRWIMIPTFLSGMIGLILVFTAKTMLQIYLAAPFMAICGGAAGPALQSEAIRKAGRKRSGIATSTYYIGADVGQGFAPMLGGVVSDHYGYSTMYGAWSGGMIAALVLVLVFERSIVAPREQKKQEKTSG